MSLVLGVHDRGTTDSNRSSYDHDHLYNNHNNDLDGQASVDDSRDCHPWILRRSYTCLWHCSGQGSEQTTNTLIFDTLLFDHWSFISSEGALIAITPYDYPQRSATTFWAHTGPRQRLEHKCYDEFGDYDFNKDWNYQDCISTISALAAKAASVHQQHQHISNISASEHQCISNISVSTASAHQQPGQH